MEAKADVRSARGLPSPGGLGRAAKAALEAGDSAKAASYASRALEASREGAAELRSRHKSNPDGRWDIPEGYYLGYFVLGRLAILKGDVREAEKDLLASGDVKVSGVRATIGPNFSLALEVLKRGDAHSRESVIRYLQEVSVFWLGKASRTTEWVRVIENGGVPDFQAESPNFCY